MVTIFRNVSVLNMRKYYEYGKRRKFVMISVGKEEKIRYEKEIKEEKITMIIM